MRFSKTGVGARIVKQKRDLDILLYLNEMGPQRADVISLKFFCDDMDNFKKSKITLASRRLKKLTDFGLLKMFYNQQRQAYWYCSKKGQNMLQENLPEFVHLKALGSIPLNLIEHMDRISWSRVALEYAGICKGFRSERRLKTFEAVLQKNDSYHLNHRPYIPDGLFIDSNNQKIIFEYEHSTKTTKQMEKRVESLESLLRNFPQNFSSIYLVSSLESNINKYSPLFNTNRVQFSSFANLLDQAGISSAWLLQRENLN